MFPSPFRRCVIFGVWSLALLGSGCSAPTGVNLFSGCCAVSGVVKRTTGEPIPGVDVQVTPDGLPPVHDNTTASGTYIVSVLGVTGTVALGDLPAECTTPTPARYDVGGGLTAKVNFSVTCTAP